MSGPTHARPAVSAERSTPRPLSRRHAADEPAIAEPAIAEPGHPLEPKVRGFMEDR
jgi:hypothetical protein